MKKLNEWVDKVLNRIKEELGVHKPSEMFSVTTSESTDDEYIWAPVYKMVSKDMRYGSVKFELNKEYTVDDMVVDVSLRKAMGNQGYIGYGRRYFKAKALVSKKSYDTHEDWSGNYYWMLSCYYLTAKKIILEEEVSEKLVMETVRAYNEDFKDVPDTYIKIAMDTDIDNGLRTYRTDILLKDGYKIELIDSIIDSDKFNLAHALSTSDISMDTKVLCIFSGKE